MSVDFPRAWEITRTVPAIEHDPRCSYARTVGGMLCDCWVLTSHPEHEDPDVKYGTDGVVLRRRLEGGWEE